MATGNWYVSAHSPSQVWLIIIKVHEKRSLSSVDQLTSQKAPGLEFPPFSPQALIEPSWDARDCSSRIRVMLSEQLIGKTTSPGELDLGATNDIVCFSFQHAPKGNVQPPD